MEQAPGSPFQCRGYRMPTNEEAAIMENIGTPLDLQKTGILLPVLSVKESVAVVRECRNGVVTVFCPHLSNYTDRSDKDCHALVAKIMDGSIPLTDHVEENRGDGSKTIYLPRCPYVTS